MKAVWCLGVLVAGCTVAPEGTNALGGRDAAGGVAADGSTDRSSDSRAPVPDAGADGPGAGPPLDAAVDASEAGPVSSSSIHVALGTPVDSDPSDDVLLDHQYFVVSYNPRRLDANWVAWHLVAADLGSVRRQDDYRADDALPPGVRRVQAGDFAGSGYDRGHLCPSADRTASVAMNSATFLMTNVVPQLHVLNAGPWEALEFQERQLVAAATREAFIVAGPVFAAGASKIGPGIEVPAADFKIIVVVDAGADLHHLDASLISYAAIMPNTAAVAGKPWTDYVVTIDEVERATGYDFLGALPVDVQAVVEARRALP